MSLQGTNPLPDYPKTLRDLTQASEILTLPSSFGSIQLGETFSSGLSVNNEATTQVDSVALKVGMQTATSKMTLAEIGGKDTSLAPLDTLENVVHHEIKELGSTCPCVPLCRHSWSPPNAIKTSSKSTSKTSHQKPSGSSGCHFEAAEGWIARDTNVITIAGDVALKRGFALVGGLRLVLVGERFVGDDVERMELGGVEDKKMPEARTLKEWNVIAEMLVS
ncbi:hypothetical protein FB446DRAFT_794307 [Lentinula raphanica]|nr:hypothetical protein FB446DRAFT_794307 [Lentinula raphanica]